VFEMFLVFLSEIMDNVKCVVTPVSKQYCQYTLYWVLVFKDGCCLV
jgi:hypothetical protein